MGLQSWSETLFTQLADGPTLTAAAEALLVTDVNIPANYLYPGMVLKATIFGRASNVVTTPGTLQLACRWGGLAGVLLAQSAQLTQNVIVQTAKAWWWEHWIVCRTVGATGTVMSWGTCHRGNCAAAVVADMTPDLIPANTPVIATIDTTTAKLLSFTGFPSLTTASITAHHYTLEARN